MDSYFGDGLPRFDGNDLLLEPCGRTAAPEAALAAELRQWAGWTRQGCCSDRCDSRVIFPSQSRQELRRAAPRTCQSLFSWGGSHSISSSTAALPPAPSLPCRFPRCSLEVAVFGQLRGDGSFRQETLQ